MIKIPFCYKVWGIAEDEEGNDGYGYVKITIDANRAITDKEYKKIQKTLVNLLPFDDDAIAIDIQEYLDNTECDAEELDLLLNYKNAV